MQRYSSLINIKSTETLPGKILPNVDWWNTEAKKLFKICKTPRRESLFHGSTFYISNTIFNEGSSLLASQFGVGGEHEDVCLSRYFIWFRECLNWPNNLSVTLLCLLVMRLNGFKPRKSRIRGRTLSALDATTLTKLQKLNASHFLDLLFAKKLKLQKNKSKKSKKEKSLSAFKANYLHWLKTFENDKLN